MNEASGSVPPPTSTAGIAAATPRKHGRQAIVLLVLVLPVALLSGADGLAQMLMVLSGTPVISEEPVAFRFIIALFTFLAAVAAISTAGGAVWASRQEMRKGSQGDTRGADEAARLAKSLCYFGWIILFFMTVNLAIKLADYAANPDTSQKTY